MRSAGGRPPATTVATHEVYDPATNKWTEAAAAAEGARSRWRSVSSTEKFTSPAAASARRPSAPTCTTSTIRRATLGRRARRCRRHAAASPERVYKGSVHGARRRTAARPHHSRRTKPTTPRPTAGARSRRCRQDVTPPAPRPTATRLSRRRLPEARRRRHDEPDDRLHVALELSCTVVPGLSWPSRQGEHRASLSGMAVTSPAMTSEGRKRS